MPNRPFSGLRQMGLLLAIPAMMVIAPLIGLFGGQWLDRRLHCSPWGAMAGLILGFVAAVREIMVMLRKSREGAGRGPGDPPK